MITPSARHGARAAKYDAAYSWNNRGKASNVPALQIRINKDILAQARFRDGDKADLDFHPELKQVDFILAPTAMFNLLEEYKNSKNRYIKVACKGIEKAMDYLPNMEEMTMLKVVKCSAGKITLEFP